MHKASDVARVFEQVAPLNSGVPGDQLGFVFGDPNRQVKGVGCVWSADVLSIRACIEQGLDMMICHEAPFLPEQTSPWYEGPAKDAIFSNNARRQLLEAHQVVVYRSHSNWDGLPGDGVADQAAAALPIKDMRTVARQKYFAVQELPEPMTVRRLMGLVEHGLGMPGCRLWGNPWQEIRRFAFLIGGFGGNQWHIPQAAREMGAEAIIVGELIELLLIGALEQGLPVIQTLHSASEIPGIKRQARVLAERLPDLPVRYVPSGALPFQAARGRHGAGHRGGSPGGAGHPDGAPQARGYPGSANTHRPH